MRCYVKECIWSGSRVPDAVARSVLSLQFCIIIKKISTFPTNHFGINIAVAIYFCRDGD